MAWRDVALIRAAVARPWHGHSAPVAKRDVVPDCIHFLVAKVNFLAIVIDLISSEQEIRVIDVVPMRRAKSKTWKKGLPLDFAQQDLP